MNSDPEVYPEPEEFRPERFLDATGTEDVIPALTHGEVCFIPLEAYVWFWILRLTLLS